MTLSEDKDDERDRVRDTERTTSPRVLCVSDRKWVSQGQEVHPGCAGSGSQDGQEVDLRMDRKWVPGCTGSTS